MTRHFYFATLLLLALIIGRLPVAAEQDTTPPPSTFLPLHEIGADWTEDEYTAGVALGDIDADGFDEMAIARHTTEGPRVFLLDDATAGFAPLATFGDGWGEAAWPTAVAFGNVDDDPAEELVVARVSPVNERAQVFDDANAGYVVLHNIGKEWPVGANAVGVAFGDVDGDGRDELGLVTDATAGNRIFILDDVTAAFAPLWAYGDGAWGAAAVATSIAFGDIDGDGIDEVAFSRSHDTNARFFVHDGAPDYGMLFSGGETWGPGAYATSVAFGNVDDDPAEELGVARKASLNERAYIYDDHATGYALLQKFGESWAFNAWATAIAFGDADGDGRDEMGLSRVATINPRVFVFDDGSPAGGAQPFAVLWGGGGEWPGQDYATAVAFGEVDAMAGADLVFGRFAAEGSRAYVMQRGWRVLLPVTSAEGE